MTTLKPMAMALFCAAALLALSPAGASALTGREIVKEQQTRHESRSEVTLSTMVVESRPGDARTRRLVVQTDKDANNASRSLLKYLEPRDIRNVGLLTWQQPGDADDDQWMYLAASGQTKRIVGGAKKNAFMGTDLAFEDMRPEDMEVHDYTLTGEETVDGQATWVIEAVPSTEAEKRDSGYAKRIFWIRQDNYMTVRTSFRDRRDRELKTATVENLEHISGDMWRGNRTVYTTVRSGSVTTSTVDSRDIGAKLPEADFLPQNIDRRPKYR